MRGFVTLHSTPDWTAHFSPAKRAVISIGNFDGLHLGHQKILRSVVECARSKDAIAAAVTFDPHPVKVLRPQQAPSMLQTLPQRLAGFADLRLDAALVLRFDATLASHTAEQFVSEILVPLRTSAIFVGSNFRFGHRQAGNVELLQQFGRQFDFTVEIVDPVVRHGIIISSTFIRQALAEGRVSEAADFLGRPFALTGQIVSGAGRGRTILVPTLNLAPDQELVPANGVYATEAEVGGRVYRSATNIGVRPTFAGTHRSIESHLFDFSEEISSGPLEVRFWKRLRDERKFDGPQALLQQIAADMDQARDFFQRRDVSPTPTTQS